jgi:flagellar protein FlaG
MPINGISSAGPMSPTVAVPKAAVPGHAAAPATSAAPAVPVKPQIIAPPVLGVTMETAAEHVDPSKMAVRISEAVNMLNMQMEKYQRGLGFSVDKATNYTVVTVRDTNTGAVVRQIPTPEALNLAHSMQALKGILFSKSA